MARTVREQMRGWRVATRPTVTCDAFCRQTSAMEEAWRQAGCVGVDMEASAALLCSDRHPHAGRRERLQWGEPHFQETKRAFIRAIAECALQMAGPEQEKTEG